MSRTRRLSHALVLVVLVLQGCAKAPPSLSPAGVRDYRANEAVLAIGQVQTAAIGLNGVSVCDPAPCHPLLSDANTRVVVSAVRAALLTIQQTPAGWKAATNTALDQIAAQLDAAGKGKFRAYIEAARVVLNAIGG